MQYPPSKFHLCYFAIPFLVKSESYDRGWNKGPFDGGDYGEYKAGSDARGIYDDKLKGNNNGNQSSGGSNFQPPDGRAGDFWGKLIMYAFVALIAVPSFFGALISSLVIWLIVSVYKKSAAIDYSQIFPATFWSAFAYLASAFVLIFLKPWIWPNEDVISDHTFIAKLVTYFSAVTNRELMSTSFLLKFHGICSIIPALVLFNKLSIVFKGFIGFIISLVLVVLVILPSIVGFFYLFSRFLPKQFQYVLNLF